jgi:hypothetical protein
LRHHGRPRGRAGQLTDRRGFSDGGATEEIRLRPGSGQRSAEVVVHVPGFELREFAAQGDRLAVGADHHPADVLDDHALPGHGRKVPDPDDRRRAGKKSMWTLSLVFTSIDAPVVVLASVSVAWIRPIC